MKFSHGTKQPRIFFYIEMLLGEKFNLVTNTNIYEDSLYINEVIFNMFKELVQY